MSQQRLRRKWTRNPMVCGMRHHVTASLNSRLVSRPRQLPLLLPLKFDFPQHFKHQIQIGIPSTPVSCTTNHPFSKCGINPTRCTASDTSPTNHASVAASPESLTFPPPAKQGDAPPPFNHPCVSASAQSRSSGDGFLKAADKVGRPRCPGNLHSTALFRTFAAQHPPPRAKAARCFQDHDVGGVR
jgi:hypothetical protein